jgi:hypothetical protein
MYVGRSVRNWRKEVRDVRSAHCYYGNTFELKCKNKKNKDWQRHIVAV